MQIEFPVSAENMDEKSYKLDKESRNGSQTFEEPEVKTSYRDTLMNYLKSFIGSGIIAIPYTFAKSGYVLSIFVTIIIAFLVNFSLVVNHYFKYFKILVQVQEHFKQKNFNYADLVEGTYGKKWRNSVILQIYLG